jgi:hypothetical protein
MNSIQYEKTLRAFLGGLRAFVLRVWPRHRLATLLALTPILIGCGLPGAHRDSRSDLGQQADDKNVQTGSPLEFVDGEGYRFSVAGIRRATTVQLEDISAAPGTVFVYVDVLVTNLQNDRTAALDDILYRWYVVAPNVSRNRTIYMCSDDSISGQCGEPAGCGRLDDPKGDQSGLGNEGDRRRTMPPKAQWKLRCTLGRGDFDFGPAGVEIHASVRPNQIHLYRKVHPRANLAKDKDLQEIQFPDQ